MREFFKGWKRKCGCMTLVMATVFMAGWVTSGSYRDHLLIRCGTNSFFAFLSEDGSLQCALMSFDNPVKFFRFVSWQSMPLPTQYLSIMTFTGFDVHYSAPYWSIVIPLTLISLWLLLSKSRKSNQEKNPENVV